MPQLPRSCPRPPLSLAGQGHGSWAEAMGMRRPSSEGRASLLAPAGVALSEVDTRAERFKERVTCSPIRLSDLLDAVALGPRSEQRPCGTGVEGKPQPRAGTLQDTVQERGTHVSASDLSTARSPL